MKNNLIIALLSIGLALSLLCNLFQWNILEGKAREVLQIRRVTEKIISEKDGQRKKLFDPGFFEDSITLKLDSYIHDNYDCGEFGGHNEHFVFNKLGDGIKMVYERDSSQCKKHWRNRLPSTVKLKYEAILVDEKKELVEVYVDKLIEHNPYPESNALNGYEIRYESHSKSIDVKITMDNGWRNYESFRDKLLGIDSK